VEAKTLLLGNDHMTLSSPVYIPITISLLHLQTLIIS